MSASSLDDRIQQAILHCPHLAARQIHFRSAPDRVVLTGCVSSYFHKQIAQETVRRIEGVSRVENQLQVIPQISLPPLSYDLPMANANTAVGPYLMALHGGVILNGVLSQSSMMW